MDKSEAIQQIREIVREACAKETNCFGFGIWTHHITQAADNARRLAPLFGADPEIVELAALLHDYASVKDQALYKEHHIHGPIEAEKILNRFGYSANTVEAVKHCIEAHRATVVAQRSTVEAECLASADAMSHLENVPSLFHLAFVQHQMGIDEGTKWIQGKLERSWNKLAPQVQDMMRQKYEAALETLASSRPNQ